MGLHDAVLIKENHIAAAGSIAAAVARARALHPGLMVETEVENFSELREALAAGADRIMLDEFELHELAQAVAEVDGRVPLEVSGSVSLDRVRAIAETGVDYVSIGALTKHVRAIDLSMRIELCRRRRECEMIEITNSENAQHAPNPQLFAVTTDRPIAPNYPCNAAERDQRDDHHDRDHDADRLARPCGAGAAGFGASAARDAALMARIHAGRDEHEAHGIQTQLFAGFQQTRSGRACR